MNSLCLHRTRGYHRPSQKKNLPATDNKLHTIPLHLEADKNWQHFYQKSFQKLFFL